ncbi:MAG TPA: hypothetical protein VGG40_00560 [Solirubrobacterales bacterium]|jgi:hypothetical protein
MGVRCVASAEAIAVAPSAIVAAEAEERCLTGAEGIAVAPSAIDVADEAARGVIASASRAVRSALMF